LGTCVGGRAGETGSRVPKEKTGVSGERRKKRGKRRKEDEWKERGERE
jgi:hypothetical protein